VVFTLPEDQLPQVQQALRKGAKLTVEAYDRSQTTLLATGKLLTLDNQIDTTTGTDKVKAVFDNKDNALFPNQFVNVRLILEQRPDTLVIPAAAVQTGSQGNFVYVVKKGDPPASGGSGGKGGSGDASSGHKHEKAAAVPDTAGAPATEEKAAGDAGSGHKHEKAAAVPDTAGVPATEGKAGGDKAGDKSDQKYYVEVRPITVDVTEGSQVIVSSGLSARDQVVIDGVERLKNGSKVTPKKSDSGSGSGRISSKGGDTTPDAAAPAVDGKSGKSSKGDKKGKSGDGRGAAAAAADGAKPHQHHHDQGQQP
jgi:multidrug efflux system membrane fusion protein